MAVAKEWRDKKRNGFTWDDSHAGVSWSGDHLLSVLRIRPGTRIGR